MTKLSLSDFEVNNIVESSHISKIRSTEFFFKKEMWTGPAYNKQLYAADISMTRMVKNGLANGCALKKGTLPMYSHVMSFLGSLNLKPEPFHTTWSLWDMSGVILCFIAHGFRVHSFSSTQQWKLLYFQVFFTACANHFCSYFTLTLSFTL